MTDHFEFSSPYGILGKAFNFFVLEKYLTDFLITRNNVIKEFAESEKWKLILNN